MNYRLSLFILAQPRESLVNKITKHNKETFTQTIKTRGTHGILANSLSEQKKLFLFCFSWILNFQRMRNNMLEIAFSNVKSLNLMKFISFVGHKESKKCQSIKFLKDYFENFVFLSVESWMIFTAVNVWCGAKRWAFWFKTCLCGYAWGKKTYLSVSFEQFMMIHVSRFCYLH